MLPRALAPLCLLLGAGAVPAFASSLEASPSHLKVELLSEQISLQPGKAVTLGVHFKMEKGWHIYWTNPGDSGQAPSVVWDLPPGFKTEPLRWPLPERLSVPPLMDYGYSGEVLLTSVLHIPRGLKPGQTVRLLAQVHWLVCKDICVPGQAGVTLRLPVKSSASALNSKTADLFKATRRKLPQTMPKDWKVSGNLNPVEFQLSFEVDKEPAGASFFPSHPDEIENAAPQGFHSTGKTFHMELKRSDQLLKSIPWLEGLLVVTGKSGEQTGYSIKAPLSVSR